MFEEFSASRYPSTDAWAFSLSRSPESAKATANAYLPIMSVIDPEGGERQGTAYCVCGSWTVRLISGWFLSGGVWRTGLPAEGSDVIIIVAVARGGMGPRTLFGGELICECGVGTACVRKLLLEAKASWEDTGCPIVAMDVRKNEGIGSLARYCCVYFALTLIDHFLTGWLFAHHAKTIDFSRTTHFDKFKLGRLEAIYTQIFWAKIVKS